MVWYKNMRRRKGVCPKFQPQWRGPCLVTRVLNDVLLEIQISKKTATVVHRDLLKECHVVNVPRWIVCLRKRRGL